MAELNKNEETVDILQDPEKAGGMMKSKKSKVITGIMFVILIGVIAWIAYGWINGLDGYGF